MIAILLTPYQGLKQEIDTALAIAVEIAILLTPYQGLKQFQLWNTGNQKVIAILLTPYQGLKRNKRIVQFIRGTLQFYLLPIRD